MYSKSPFPLFSTPNFALCLSKEACGHLRELELIGMPNCAFEVTAELPNYVVEIDYPYDARKKLYTDKRFMDLIQRKEILPLQSEQAILDFLLSKVGKPYVWGGNWSDGIPKMKELYPAYKSYFAGVDCSGLLYEATRGYTPRNTSQILDTTCDVKGAIKPLDVIVWKGHMIIALDSRRVIESREGSGVVISNLSQRLDSVKNYSIKRLMLPTVETRDALIETLFDRSYDVGLRDDCILDLESIADEVSLDALVNLAKESNPKDIYLHDQLAESIAMIWNRRDRRDALNVDSLPPNVKDTFESLISI